MSKKLKLTTLSEAILKDKETNAIKGGKFCTCSCYWEDTEGSSPSGDNRSANYTLGMASTHGCNQYFEYSTESGRFSGEFSSIFAHV